MKILVTGATGYFGRELALYLARMGNDVHILARDPYSPYVPVHLNIRVYKGDVTNSWEVTRAMKSCTQVYHAAAEVKMSSASIFETNVNGTKIILDSALAEGVSKIVFTSTCAILARYTNHPVNESERRIHNFTNNYELSKFFAENMVLEYSLKGLKIVIVALSKIFGPGLDRRTPSMISMVKRVSTGKLTMIPAPSQTIANFVYIKDAVKGHILAMEKGLHGEKYIIGGENISYREFFHLAASLNGKKPRLLPVPLTLAKWSIGIRELFMKLYRKTPLATRKSVAEIYEPKSYCSDKAITALGYKITPLHEALLRTVHLGRNKHHAQPKNKIH